MQPQFDTDKDLDRYSQRLIKKACELLASHALVQQPNTIESENFYKAYVNVKLALDKHIEKVYGECKCGQAFAFCDLQPLHDYIGELIITSEELSYTYKDIEPNITAIDIVPIAYNSVNFFRR